MPPAPHRTLETCPVCQKEVKAKRFKPLYELLVCKKCVHGFVNRRQIAYIVDAIVFQVIYGIAYTLFADFVLRPAPGGPQGLAFGDLTDMVFGWVVGPLMFAFKDGFSGMSPGKRLFGVQVVDATTLEPISFRESFKRNVVLMIPFVAVIIALRMIKGPRLGDRWANTKVVWRKYAHRPPFDPRGVHCVGCGYDLTGNVSGICPECGRPIDRAPSGIVPAPMIARPIAPVVRPETHSRRTEA